MFVGVPPRPWKRLSITPGLGSETRFHEWPFQCSTRFFGKSSPTAHAFFGPKAATPLRTLEPRGGRVARFHFAPFQCRIIALLPEAPSKLPPAHASLAEIAATSISESPESPVPKFGDGTTFHLAPFQCNVSVFNGKPEPLVPTAQMSWAETASRSNRILSFDAPP